jgi:hypothetical protein
LIEVGSSKDRQPGVPGIGGEPGGPVYRESMVKKLTLSPWLIFGNFTTSSTSSHHRHRHIIDVVTSSEINNYGLHVERLACLTCNPRRVNPSQVCQGI